MLRVSQVLHTFFSHPVSFISLQSLLHRTNRCIFFFTKRTSSSLALFLVHPTHHHCLSSHIIVTLAHTHTHSFSIIFRYLIFLLRSFLVITISLVIVSKANTPCYIFFPRRENIWIEKDLFERYPLEVHYGEFVQYYPTDNDQIMFRGLE